MSPSSGHTASPIARLRAGDPSARNDLIAHTEGRLRELASRMLRGFPRVARWEQTDDVFQNAMIRLCRALDADTPQSVRHFFNLVTQHIRWELHDLADRHGGPLGHGANHQTDRSGAALSGVVGLESGPAELEDWADFHRRVKALPDEEREVVELHWYGGLSHAEAAEVLGVSDRTVKRRWMSARLALAK
jgi:RNA polymerase sigma factor (sigma-70 family)